MIYEIKKTALQLACCRNDKKLVKSLLTIDTIDINEENFCGETALDIMCRKGNSEIANILLDAGAELKLRDYTQLIKHLFTRTDISKYELLDILAEIGISMQNVNSEGDTLIQVACRCNNLNILKKLKFSNTELNIQNRAGETGLHIAARNGNLTILKYLIEQGIDVNIQNNIGQTALHIAVEQNNYILVKELVESGSRLDIEDICKRNPLNLKVSNQAYVLQVFRLNILNLEHYCKSENFKAIKEFFKDNKLNIYKVLAVKFLLDCPERLNAVNLLKKKTLINNILKETNMLDALKWSLYYKDYKTFHYLLRSQALSIHDLTVRFGQGNNIIDLAHKVNPNVVEFLEARKELLEKNCEARNENIGKEKVQKEKPTKSK